MTSFETIYKAFLSKILDDEWDTWTKCQMEQDLFTLLEAAVSDFKFPRISLDYNDDGFTETLTNAEIQVLSILMRCHWLNRTILSWENIKPLYEERDFSQANLLDKFNNRLEAEWKNAHKKESDYYRAVNHRPFDYSALTRQADD